MTSASDIAFASALDLVELYRTQALSPVEAAEALLDRAEALQPKLNAFCVIDRDGALEAARAAERRWRDGEPLGPLDGVPVTIKDLVLMRGFPTRRGSRMIDPVPDTEDGPAVARLREAGAVILGKTTTPEFGWKAIGDSPLTGITRNPWNLDRTPGGSSAGAAAACAAGIAPLHVGSDGAGSIRIPSRLYRHFRHQGDIRAGAGASGLADGAVVEYRADDAQRARRGADAEHAGAARPPRPVRAAAGAPDVSRRHRGRRAAAGGSPTAPISATPKSIPRSPPAVAEGGAALRGAGSACRAGRPDLRLAAPGAADPVGGRRRARHGRRFRTTSARSPIRG